MKILENNNMRRSADERALLDAHKGQAHFPDQKRTETCASCLFWATREGSKSTARYCKKAAELAGKYTYAVPASAMACKYYEGK